MTKLELSSKHAVFYRDYKDRPRKQLSTKISLAKRYSKLSRIVARKTLSYVPR